MPKKTPDDMLVGTIHKTSKYGELVITKYTNFSLVNVRFLNTGFETTTQAHHIRQGSVKDRLAPTVFGVGFIGVGKFSARVNGKTTKEYKTWQHMIQRCCDIKFKQKNPTYIDCTVCPEWHDFQVFGQWYEDNYPKDGGNYELDKDILVEGNKLYSPDTCKLVTRAENTIKARAKEFTFTCPEGNKTLVYNLAAFCRERGLNKSYMHKVFSGKLRQHKGWSAYLD